jgi:hypothetical protein
VSGWRRAKRRKPLPPTFMTTSFVSEGFAPRRLEELADEPLVTLRLAEVLARDRGELWVAGDLSRGAGLRERLLMDR